MKTPPRTNLNLAQRKPRAFLIVAIGLVGLLILGWVIFEYFFANYAAQTAKPLETALAKMGAVKQCSRSAAGRGPDNNEPRYHAIYEVPGNRQEATDFVQTVAKEAGFSLKDGPEPVNPQDNKFYSDQTTKKSAYTQLQPGNIDLSFTIFGSSTYTGKGDQFCTVTKRENPPQNRTTIDFTVNLPEFKR